MTAMPWPPPSGPLIAASVNASTRPEAENVGMIAPAGIPVFGTTLPSSVRYSVASTGAVGSAISAERPTLTAVDIARYSEPSGYIAPNAPLGPAFIAGGFGAMPGVSANDFVPAAGTALIKREP